MLLCIGSLFFLVLSTLSDLTNKPNPLQSILPSFKISDFLEHPLILFSIYSLQCYIMAINIEKNLKLDFKILGTFCVCIRWNLVFKYFPSVKFHCTFICFTEFHTHIYALQDSVIYR